MRLPFLTILLLSCAPSALSCSCVGGSTACGSLIATPVVFVGKVTVDSGEGIGKGPATMIVQEVLHGIPADVKEVVVETSAGNSCYMRLQLGETYVIYGSSINGRVNAISRHTCSFSFNIHGNESLLDALRGAEGGGPARLVGKVHQMQGKYDWIDGVPGIHITARSGNKQLETQTQANGQFAFLNVLPSQYILRVSSPEYFQDPSWAESPRGTLVVPKASCEERGLYVWPDNAISGIVRDQSGKAPGDIPVQVFQSDPRGAIDSSPLREARTDSEGRYSVHGLPPGGYFIGVNAEKYSDRLAYPPTFYPAGARREEALKITLTKSRDGINFTLPPPRLPCAVWVETVFEDGSPAFSPVLMVEDMEGIQRAFHLPPEESTSNLHRLNLFQGDRYIVKSEENEVESIPSGDANVRFKSRHWAGNAGPVVLDRSEVHVRVVLRETPARIR